MVLEVPLYRSPSEADSLLVRVMRECPQDCGFCSMYTTLGKDGILERNKPSRRTVQEVKYDIDAWRRAAEGATVLSNIGYVSGIHFLWYRNYANAPETAFLGDADVMLVPGRDLAEMVRYLHDVFPSIKRTTAYAIARSITRKTPEELDEIRQAGLDRLLVGLESGSDKVLSYMDKRATADIMIQAGNMAQDSGYELSLFVMPGLGGVYLSEEHAAETARVLNAIDPAYARMRPLHIVPGTPLHQTYQRGEFRVLSKEGLLREMRSMIDALNTTGRVTFDHDMNPEIDGYHVFNLDYEGYQFPEEKSEVLRKLDDALEQLAAA